MASNNADGHFGYQTIPIKRALAKSINSITARLTDEVELRMQMYYANKWVSKVNCAQ